MTKRERLLARAKSKASAARSAIDAGMGVIAIEPTSKRPDTRFSPHGSKSATKSMGDVRSWLRTDPTINLAAVVKDTPILVVDVDGPEGEVALDQFGSLPPTRETITRDGRHLFFRHRGKVKSSRLGFSPKLDLIVSGYVLLPESAHPEGGRYKSDDFDLPVADLPRQAIDVINARKKADSAVVEISIDCPGECWRNTEHRDQKPAHNLSCYIPGAVRCNFLLMA